MDFAIFLLTVVVVFYGIAFLFFMRGFFRTENRRFSWAGRLIELGFLTHTLLIFVQTLTSVPGMPSDFHLPVATVGEASGFFAWSLAFVYLILLRQLKGETFGLILTPVLVLFLIPAFFPFPVNDALLKHFHNHYFLIHILSAFFGYGCFTLSFITGLLYLILDRTLKQKVSVAFYRQFPALEDLERLIFRMIFWGVFLLGIAIISGSLWAKSDLGVFVLREPKSFASFLTWGVYLAIIYWHELLQKKGRRVVLMSLWAFLLVLFTFLGTSLYPGGLHVGI